MSAEEEEAILLQMKLQEGRPELTCRFKWEAGSIAMWCGTRPLSLFVPSPEPVLANHIVFHLKCRVVLAAAGTIAVCCTQRRGTSGPIGG